MLNSDYYEKALGYSKLVSEISFEAIYKAYQNSYSINEQLGYFIDYLQITKEIVDG